MSVLKLLLYITDRDLTSSSPPPHEPNHTQVITAGYNSNWHKERADPKIAEAKSKKREEKEGKGKGKMTLVKRLRRKSGTGMNSEANRT
ncbi:uncharacterized protein H6S33_011323 [Morchella sextelata]|uniref:uncharacterized protein n=1 Tax=Morchella sextelata TaxID=1174677 RepID=UPI001D03B196|nr:uncharacterized protein H6S33_011323 [Morchella sextelata]KAH0610896.1 hypothetical protein H6S33_011323 [Morchella sextelata]